MTTAQVLTWRTVRTAKPFTAHASFAGNVHGQKVVVIKGECRLDILSLLGGLGRAFFYVDVFAGKGV